MKKWIFTAAVCALLSAAGTAGADNTKEGDSRMNTIANDTRIFRINPEIRAGDIRFKNRFGIELAGHLYLPKGFDPAKRYAAVAVCGPFGVSIFLTRGCPISVNGPVGESETAAPIHLPPPTLPFPSAQ